ncbi:MAG: ATP synthase F1 subunit delta [Patescibacteria group bacterium]
MLEPKELARTLVDHAADASSEKLSSIIKSFVQFLAEEKMIDSWREIERSIHEIWKEKYGASQVTVTSAHDLSAQARSQLQKMSKGADVIEKVDEALIGGAVIRIDDTRIDGSVSGALQKLKMQLSA